MFAPSLHVFESADRVRITLLGIAQGSGPTFEDATDELVRKLLIIAMAFRAGSVVPASTELRLDPAVYEFIWELATMAANGEDIRERVFAGP